MPHAAAAAACGQILPQSFNGGSRDLKVQPERDAWSPGPAVVLGRDLISPPGHNLCKTQSGRREMLG